jgi:transcriptional regulator with XRE-family HTH domain
MQKTVYSKAHDILREGLIAARKGASLTQQTLADRLRKPQSFVAKYENGERRLDVVEFLRIAQAMGIKPKALLERVSRSLDD